MPQCCTGVGNGVGQLGWGAAFADDAGGEAMHDQGVVVGVGQQGQSAKVVDGVLDIKFVDVFAGCGEGQQDALIDAVGGEYCDDAGDVLAERFDGVDGQAQGFDCATWIVLPWGSLEGRSERVVGQNCRILVVGVTPTGDSGGGSSKGESEIAEVLGQHVGADRVCQGGHRVEVGDRLIAVVDTQFDVVAVVAVVGESFVGGGDEGPGRTRWKVAAQGVGVGRVVEHEKISARIARKMVA